MAAPYEQDVILDADGQPIFTALARVQQQVSRINKNVVDTAKELNVTLANMGTMLETQAKTAQQRMSQISSLARANNFAGLGIQDADQRRKLGQLTTSVTEYSRGLETAGTAAEAFQTRLNRLNDAIAARGRLNRGETLTQTRQRKMWQDQKRDVEELDKALGKLQSRAGRTAVGPGDRLGANAAAQRVADARAALTSATRDPTRNSFLPEIGRLREATAAMDNFFNDLRGKQAARLVDQRNTARAMERVEVNSLNNRAKQEDAMWAAREKRHTSAVKRSNDIETAYSKAETARLSDREKQMDAMWSRREKAAATRSTTRLTPAEELGLAETSRMNFGGISGDEARKLRSQQNRAELDDMKAAGAQRAKELRDINAVNSARAQSAMRLNELRAARRAANNPADHEYLTRQIKGEQAYSAALRSRRTELERAANAEAKQNASGGRPSPTSRIMSPGYLGAAALRTGVYGAAAMGVYSMFDTIRGGFQYVTQFEDELAKLQAIAGATNGQMVGLKQSILGVADGSRYSTVELTKISQNLAQAGVAASEMEDALKAVTNLAAASGSTPDEAVNLVTAALGAFQLQANEAARVADLMVTALNRTRLTVTQAGAAIQYVGATAFEQNIALDELLATAAAMSQAGVKSGSTIGTGMRQFLVDLQSPSKNLQEQFDKLNLTTEQLDVTTRGLPAVLETLRTSGFGAAQAYEGLETRAAAAYLVLKNNTGLIDELRLQMTETGTATDASAKAMDSFTAQWQRFKNNMGETSAEVFQPFVDGLKNVLKSYNDFKEAQRDMNLDTGTSAAQRWQNDMLTIRDSTGEVIFALGDWDEQASSTIENWISGTSQAEAATLDMETQINSLSERISQHTGLISELENEYQRLLVQEESLINNHDRLDAETASLTSRFEHLGVYLDNTKSMYESLTGAVWQYIQATQQALAADLAIRQTQLANQAVNITKERRAASSRLSGMDLSKLTPEERRLVESLNNAGSMNINDYRYASRKLAGAGRRDGILGTPLGDALNELTGAMGNLSSTVQAQEIARRQEGSALAAGTKQGASVSLNRERAESLITRSRSERGAERDATVAEARAAIAAARNDLNFTPKPEFKQYFDSQRAELDSLEQMLKGMLAPSKKERDAAEKERKAAERKEKADRVIPFSNPLANMNQTSGMGMRNGREHKGVDLGGKIGDAVMVTADGVVKKVAYEKDGYGNYVVVDHGGGTESRYAHLSSTDVVEGQLLSQGQRVGGLGSTGRSTGPHLHYEVRQDGKPVNPLKGQYTANPDFTKDAERYAEQEERARERYQKALDSRDVKLAEKKLELAIGNAAKATTSEAFAAAVGEAEGALKGLEETMTRQAENELAAEGLGPLDPEYHTRLMQLEDDIAQRAQEYRNKVVDGIFKNVENAFAAAEGATAEVLAQYDRVIQMAEARVSGFGYASMQGKVPDYMQQLADRNVAKAQESRDRARLGALPSEIGSKESALAEAQRQLDLMQQTDAAYEDQAQKVRELTAAIRELRNEKDTLATALSVADTLPQSLREGLDKAIEAYREYHNLNRTLQEEVIFNMGGALTQLHEGLNTFFTDVFTRSKGVLAAFGDMVMGMLKYMQQLAAQFVANQIFKVLLNLIGSAVAPTGGSTDGGLTGAILPSTFGYRGGKMTEQGIQRFYGGGKVKAGVRSRDSALAMIAKDEWVINRSAADSVGDDFMSDLNKRGAMAVRDAAGSPAQMIQMPKQETNVYVVRPDEKPSLGPNDVLVVMRDDMVNGEGRKLIRTIAQGG